MSKEEKTYTLDEAHKGFAAGIHGRVWELLEKSERNAKENDEMLYAAHASSYHWLKVGKGVNHQRGEWLISRVYAVLNLPDAALRHAKRCLDLTEEHKAEMKDFDFAFAFEGIARAHAVAGNKEETLKYLAEAEKAGAEIQDPEDKKVFDTELNGGNWNNLR